MNAPIVRSFAGIGLLVLGGSLLFGAGIAWTRRERFLSEAVEVHGAVVDESKVSLARLPGESGGSARYRVDQGRSSPIVEFSTGDGKVHRFTSRLSTWGAGDMVTVLYLPSNPANAEIKNSFAQTGWILVLAGVGAAVFAGGAMILLAGGTNQLPP